ncbi:MAG: hypothetical protein Nkreftii_000469 [Candidatus Nitrospira kreftii]|uniref:Uncharacterized protein n=1 Tax=Candidatus Nitrospira kreftii TaxID=2652173 RepID=A0A7S8FBC3_9BACT|nr:MAG: hypothetical protein Nkreftii_000469 [Candidatus Nitrospira kreftii]
MTVSELSDAFVIGRHTAKVSLHILRSIVDGFFPDINTLNWHLTFVLFIRNSRTYTFFRANFGFSFDLVLVSTSVSRFCISLFL